jgi:hypothetical protein
MSLDYGIHRLKGTPQRIKDFIDQNLERWAQEGLQDVIDVALRKGMHPDVARSWRVEKTGYMKVDMVWEYPGPKGEPIQVFLEYGAKPHEIAAKIAKALKIPLPSGKTIFRKKVKHPGIQAINSLAESIPKFNEALKFKIHTETNAYLEREAITVG